MPRAAAAVRPGVAFVGAHPMFGGHGGYAGAVAAAGRWRGGTVAVCTDGDPGAVARVVAFHEALGARAIRCTAAEHDAAVAMVSHLPYLVASALAATAAQAGPLARALAGPGLKDTTRLAEFPFDIQGEVARRNAHLPAAAAKLQAAAGHPAGRRHRLARGGAGGAGAGARRARGAVLRGDCHERPADLQPPRTAARRHRGARGQVDLPPRHPLRRAGHRRDPRHRPARRRGRPLHAQGGGPARRHGPRGGARGGGDAGRDAARARRRHRLRQLRHLAPAPGRRAGRPARALGAHRRRLAAPPPGPPGHRAAPPHGRASSSPATATGSRRW